MAERGIDPLFDSPDDDERSSTPMWFCRCGRTLTAKPGRFLECCREAGLVN